MDFATELKAIVDRIPYQKENVRNEQQTIDVLVRPFIEALGYDLTNPLETPSQHTLGSGGRVDYAILADGRPVIIFECKPANTGHLSDNQGQLKRYFDEAKPVVGILTNGIQYQFFSDLDQDGSMDADPFLEVDLEDLSDRDFTNDNPELKSLSLFTKSQFNADAILSAAVTLNYKRGIRRFLEQQFSGDSLDEEFVKMLASRVHAGNRTPRVLKNLGNLAGEVISEFKSELVKSSATGSQHTTSSEEVEGHFTVKNILWNIVDSDSVILKDATSYCKIQLDDNERSRKVVCRLYFNDLNRKKLGLQVSNVWEQVDIQSVGEINSYANRIREAARQILDQES